MLVRLRSSTLTILGFVAAVGLGMVAVVSQQGWPDVRTGPLPQAPSAEFAYNDPIAAPAGTFVLPPLFEGIEASAPVRSDRRTADSDSGVVPASRLTDARQVAAVPAEPAPTAPAATPEPVGQEPAPTTQASTPSPTQTTAGVGSAAGEGGSSPVTAGTGRPPAVSDEGQGRQDDPGPPSWAGNDNGRDDWSDDGWDDNDQGHWSDDDSWDDDDRGGYGHGHDNDRGGWGRH